MILPFHKLPPVKEEIRRKEDMWIPKMLNYFTIILTLYLYKIDISLSKEEDANAVNVSGILIQGKIMTSLDGRSFWGFLGIPYARPPIGKLRFRPPQQWISKTGFINATREPPICPQLRQGTEEVIGNEDCLYLNVYTHKLSNFPVVVILHRGDFSSGNGGPSELGPEYLMNRNLVIVTLNYRLGALGFLSTGDSELPGNYGLKDQLQALRWVKDNIHYFGGDTDRITLYGIGAGGACAQYHLLSPGSKGLFHRLFYQSGSAFNFWAFQQDPISVARRVASVLGCQPRTTSSDMVACFVKVSARDLVRTLYHFPHSIEHLPYYPFRPVLESQSSTDDPPFLSKHPETIIQSGSFNHVPTLAGVAHDECVDLAWIVFHNKSLLAELNKDFAHTMRISFHFDHLPKDSVMRIRQFYFEDEPVVHASLRSLIRLFSDCMVTQAVCWAAKEQAATSYSPVYFYRFSYKGRISTFMPEGSEPIAVGSGDELFYIFKSSNVFPDGLPTFEERGVILRWEKVISNFAAYGNPIPEETIIFPELWLPLGRKKKFKYMNFEAELSMLENQRLNARLEFWDSIVKDIRRKAHKIHHDEL